MKPNVYIIAGGGTGGHLYPALAVVEALVKLDVSAKVIFACSDRPIDRRVLDALPYGVAPQSVKPLPRGIGDVWPFIRSWFATRKQANDMLRDLKPKAVLGTGGFASGPLLREAGRMGVPSGLLNPDAVPGKANQYLAKFTDAIFTQFASTKECFPSKSRGKIQPLGCPVRLSLLAGERAEGLKYLQLRPDRKTLIVLGGSLGAASVSQAAAALASDMESLADRWQMVLVTGPAKGSGLTDAFKSAAFTVRCIEYCDRMDLAYAAADLMLCRGGASTIAELTAVGVPSIILPYPYHKDQQQRLNAQELAQSGGAVVCEDLKDPSANAAMLRNVLLPLMGDDSRLATMRAAAKALGKPEAAVEIARWLTGEGGRK